MLKEEGAALCNMLSPLILDDFSGLVFDFLLLVFMHDYVTNFV